ncbi:MAG: TonB-dependent receptor plug domain-containing protein, partial [Acidobacteria bacterium]|nr:TonB-dependent receptor plug domain-containing protein [Acidobacteriota bacterium]
MARRPHLTWLFAPLACAAIVLLSAAGAVGQETPPQSPDATLAGHVVDLSGAAVAGATVQARRSNRVVAATRTAGSGDFSLAVSPGPIDLVATASDLAPAFLHVAVAAGQRREDLRLVLGASLFSESVTVAAALPEAGTSASTSVLDAATLMLVPGRALDDVLATTPGFGLFRRSSSRAANPTAQGVSLRGLAASGASRALVLADGIPANDPFGGWVYWNRLPSAAIDRVEVARGGWSDRYGAGAVGGVVQVLTASASGTDARLVAEAGSRATGRVSGFAGVARRGWSAIGAIEAARAGRAPIVAARARGPIDVEAGVRHASALGAVTWTSGPAFTGTARVNPFGEDRDNGTPAQRNDTRSVQLALAASGVAGAGGWEVRAWGQRARFGQTFSAVAPGRGSETPTTTQRVDSEAIGGRASWSQPLGLVALVAGFEARQVHADNVEIPTLGGPSRTAGGRQRGPDVFARVAAPLGPRLSIEGGGRWET